MARSSTIYKRRRDHVMRENPKFFSTAENAGHRSRNSVNAEYERLVAFAAYDRNPKCGSQRPEGGAIPSTPLLKPVDPNVPSTSKNGNYSLLDAGFEGTSAKKNKQLQRERAMSATKSKRPELADLVLDPKEETISESAKHLSSPELTPISANFDWAADLAENGEQASFQPDTFQGEVEDFIQPDIHTNEYAEPVTSSMNSTSWEFGNVGSGELTATHAGAGYWGAGVGSLEEADGDGWSTVQNPRTSRGPRVSTVEENTNPRGCFNCGQEGHRKNECPEPPKARARACRTCGEEGHIARECPLGSSSGGGGVGGGAGSGRACHKCGEVGHIARECPTGDFGGSGGGGRACRNCGQEGHLARECPQGGAGGRELACHNCGGQGHFARECPSGGSGGGGGRGCFTCGEYGHRAADCPQGGGGFGGRSGHSGGYGGGGCVCYKCGEPGHFARECPGASGEGYPEDAGGFGFGGEHHRGFEEDFTNDVEGHTDLTGSSNEPFSDAGGISW